MRVPDIRWGRYVCCHWDSSQKQYKGLTWLKDWNTNNGMSLVEHRSPTGNCAVKDQTLWKVHFNKKNSSLETSIDLLVSAQVMNPRNTVSLSHVDKGPQIIKFCQHCLWNETSRLRIAIIDLILGQRNHKKYRNIYPSFLTQFYIITSRLTICCSISQRPCEASQLEQHIDCRGKWLPTHMPLFSVL